MKLTDSCLVRTMDIMWGWSLNIKKEIVCEFRNPRKKIIYSFRFEEHTKGDALIHPWGVTVNPPIYCIMKDNNDTNGFNYNKKLYNCN